MVEAIVEQNISDQGSKSGRAVPADEIGLSGRDWEANVELESFLAYPFDIKDTIEHRKQCTGAQNLMFLYDLRENYCHKDARLEVKSCQSHSSWSIGIAQYNRWSLGSWSISSV